MSRGEIPFALWVMLAGCTSLLQLDDVTSDFDHDGIADGADVCPRDYDPVQETHPNGVGVACGPCSFATHDIDGDGRDDSCDSCIGAGAVGVDADADGIDDGCDGCVGDQDTTGVDTDLDGVLDGCDTCIASGFDLDRDDVDDACDVCVFGSNADEDLDGIADGCDVCPADADPDQTVAGDEGDIGVACDPDPMRDDVRWLFDGFAVVDEDIWYPSTEWQTYDGAMHPLPSSPADRISFYSMRAEFVVRTFVRFDIGTSSVNPLGLALTRTLGVTYLTECTIDPLGVLRSGALASTTPLDVSQGVEVRLTRVADAGEARGRCEASDHTGAVVTLSELTYPDLSEMDLGLIGRGALGHYDWIEAIDHPLPQ